jgi:hypothetical protein
MAAPACGTTQGADRLSLAVVSTMTCSALSLSLGTLCLQYQCNGSEHLMHAHDTAQLPSHQRAASLRRCQHRCQAACSAPPPQSCDQRYSTGHSGKPQGWTCCQRPACGTAPADNSTGGSPAGDYHHYSHAAPPRCCSTHQLMLCRLPPPAAGLQDAPCGRQHSAASSTTKPAQRC